MTLQPAHIPHNRPSPRRRSGQRWDIRPASKSFNRLTTVTVTYSHDGAGRITSKTSPEGETRYSYDANGRITSASNNHISYNFNHDAAGRIISVNDSLGNSLSYSYDANGNRTGVTLPDARQISYSYDASNNPVKITFPAGEFSIGYNAVNQRASLTYPNGITTAYTFDKAGNLTKLAHKKVTTLSYSYDKAGNRTKLTQDNISTSYSYDKSYQLTNAGTDSYKYDAAGNRISGPNAKTIYTTGTGNQTLSTDKQAKNATYPKAEFKYDRNGNLTEKKEYDNSGNIRQSSLFGYDSDNMLITAEITRDGKKKEISYLYDPFGRRIEKNIKTDELNDEGDTEEEGTPRITRYLYDGPNIIQQTNGKGKVTATYIHGPGIDEPLAIETRTKDWYYYHADALGSILALTDANGKTVQTYSYDAFGNTKKNGNKVKQPFGFTGRELDPETGLYSYRLRTYDQNTGKFISKDPLGFAAGDVNLYRYVGNSSPNYIDPWGLANLNLFSPGTLVARQTDLWNPSGYYSISGHGNPVHMSGPNKEVVTVEDLVTMIKSDPNFTGQPVFLESCSTGKGKDSFAQRLADKLGVIVKAPTDDVSTTINTFLGIITGFSSTVKNGGEYKPFSPRINR